MKKTKTVYSFGPDRLYIGPVELDESDLSPADEGAVCGLPRTFRCRNLFPSRP